VIMHQLTCSSAARMAMSILKNGDSAIVAVEAAIRVLEDKEITNAGYGSNLTIEGVVECDATIVDHFGRSGACGATASKYLKPSATLTSIVMNLIKLLYRNKESHTLSSCDTRSIQPPIVAPTGSPKFACWRRGNCLCL
jgi:taspase (threonine aspartase 1)